MATAKSRIKPPHPSTVNAMARRILHVYAQANKEERTAGFLWYLEAHEVATVLARQYGVTVERIAGCIAAISPGVRWSQNIEWAEHLAAFWYRDKPLPGKVPTYSQKNVDKAERCLGGHCPDDILGGPKVTAFYRLIRDGGNATDLVLDSHAVNLAVGSETVIRGEKARSIPRAEFRAADKAYRKVAAALGIQPHQLQAVVWIVWRRLLEEKRKASIGEA